MSSESSQNSQPVNSDADNAEDISVPTLSSANRFRLLVVPQELQVPLFRKTYRTMRSGRVLRKMKGFMDLPIEVVIETAMYLAPKDLLQLSRLSKQFRSMFASRSSLFVWQTVFRNVDLKSFEDLNEIQFASLLYDKCCMACGRITMGCLLFPLLRLRLCPCCQTANLVNKDELKNQYPNAGNLINMLPASSSDGCKCFKPEAHLLIEKFLSLKKENSRFYFIANMIKHTRARRESSATKSFTSNVSGRRVRWSCRCPLGGGTGPRTSSRTS